MWRDSTYSRAKESVSLSLIFSTFSKALFQVFQSIAEDKNVLIKPGKSNERNTFLNTFVLT